MQALMESVPNFSEGRREDVIVAIEQAANSVSGVRVLDRHSDTDHNRTVLTLVGPPNQLQESVYRAMERATELIDLRHHDGAHPRVGATDVVPFIPLAGTTMDDAINAARQLGQRVADKLKIPVYFYEEAAIRPDRQNLEQVRRKGFEELRDRIQTDEDRSPDLGPYAIHESAGAVIIGARGPLIAYNIYLNTNDLRIAKRIARAIRNSSGGLRYVKAMGIDIPDRGQVQVSMNLTNFHRTAVHTVFNLVRDEAQAYGVSISESEVVGLIPLAALADAGRYFLRLHEFKDDQILELKLLENLGAE